MHSSPSTIFATSFKEETSTLPHSKSLAQINSNKRIDVESSLIVNNSTLRSSPSTTLKRLKNLNRYQEGSSPPLAAMGHPIIKMLPPKGITVHTPVLSHLVLFTYNDKSSSVSDIALRLALITSLTHHNGHYILVDIKDGVCQFYLGSGERLPTIKTLSDLYPKNETPAFNPDKIDPALIQRLKNLSEAKTPQNTHISGVIPYHRAVPFVVIQHPVTLNLELRCIHSSNHAVLSLGYPVFASGDLYFDEKGRIEKIIDKSGGYNLPITCRMIDPFKGKPLNKNPIEPKSYGLSLMRTAFKNALLQVGVPAGTSISYELDGWSETLTVQVPLPTPTQTDSDSLMENIEFKVSDTTITLRESTSSDGETPFEFKKQAPTPRETSPSVGAFTSNVKTSSTHTPYLALLRVSHHRLISTLNPPLCFSPKPTNLSSSAKMTNMMEWNFPLKTRSMSQNRLEFFNKLTQNSHTVFSELGASSMKTVKHFFDIKNCKLPLTFNHAEDNKNYLMFQAEPQRTTQNTVNHLSRVGAFKK